MPAGEARRTFYTWASFVSELLRLPSGAGHDAAVLAALCEAQILKKKKAEVLASLEGDWQEHHLFALRQALKAYRFYHQQIADCDEQIEKSLRELKGDRPIQKPPPEQKVKVVRHNAPQEANGQEQAAQRTASETH